MHLTTWRALSISQNTFDDVASTIHQSKCIISQNTFDDAASTIHESLGFGYYHRPFYYRPYYHF